MKNLSLEHVSSFKKNKAILNLNVFCILIDIVIKIFHFDLWIHISADNPYQSTGLEEMLQFNLKEHFQIVFIDEQKYW
jgi:hypothetical protein